MRKVQNISVKEILSMERSFPAFLLLIDTIKELAENEASDPDAKDNELLLFQRLLENYPELPEDKLYEKMHELNAEYLDDERQNLDIQFSQPILVIGDLGFWNGRAQGYKMVNSGNIRDCLYSDTDMTEWYVDKNGDLRADAIHHDGTNHYLYRVFKRGVTDAQIENLQDKIYCRRATRTDITRVTQRLGDSIAAVYGFRIPKQRTRQHDAR